MGLNCIQEFVSLQTVALSKQAGEVEFYLADRIDDGSHSLVAGIHNEKVTPIKVKTVTMDQHVAKTGVAPTAVKIDVEGAEALVLDGAVKTISSEGAPLFVIETGDRMASQLGESARSVLSRLYSKGYRIFRLDEAPTRLVELTPEAVTPDVYNYAALPPRFKNAESVLALTVR